MDPNWQERSCVDLPVRGRFAGRMLSLLIFGVTAGALLLAMAVHWRWFSDDAVFLLFVAGTLVAAFGSVSAVLQIGRATVGTDGVYHDVLWSRWFVPWARLRDARQAQSTDSAAPIDLILRDGTRIRVLPRIESCDESGVFLGRLRDGLEDPVFIARSDMIDPEVRRGESLSELSGSAYRTRPISHSDLWSLARDPHALPDVRASALAGMAAELSSDERGELAVMAQATAHPQVRAIMIAAHAGENEATLARLARETKANPVSVR